MKSKKLILGTALWGWAIPRAEAFSILDRFVEAGNSWVDCATNYPINKNKEDYGLALEWLSQWCSMNKNSIRILVKIGSVDNLGSSLLNLSKKYIFNAYDDLLLNFGSSLSCISVHWDNRKNSDLVKETVFALNELKNQNIDIGLSGIENPKDYYEAMPKLADCWIIQCKENLLTNNARLKYQKFFPNACYYAYGINIGGLKIAHDGGISAKIRRIDHSSRLKEIFSDALNNDFLSGVGLDTVNGINMSFIYINPAYDGIIIGPRNLEQLNSTLKVFETLNLLNLDDRASLIGFLKGLQSSIKFQLNYNS